MEKGALMYTSVSICCQHKSRFEAQHQSHAAYEPEHLLFRGRLAAYPLTHFIKSPWKNCPKKKRKGKKKWSCLSECPGVTVF